MNDNLIEIEAETEAIENKIFSTFLISIFSLTFTVLFLLLIFLGKLLFFIPFLTSLVLNIIGFAKFMSLKKYFFSLKKDIPNKLKTIQVMLWINLVILLTSLLFAAVILIEIGLNGYGR